MMTHHCHPFGAAHRPVAAGLVGNPGAVGFRPCQHVMPVRCVAAAIHHFALFIQRRLLGDAVGVAVQRGDIVGDFLTLGVEPRAFADAVAGILGAC